MRFGYTIIYVHDVTETIAFYEQAFGMGRRFVAESGDYGELETGSTALAFAANQLGALNIPDGYIHNEAANLPPGIEIAFISDDVAAAYAQAVQAGAYPVAAPKIKPWGQEVAYVRDLNGVLIELCSPM